MKRTLTQRRTSWRRIIATRELQTFSRQLINRGCFHIRISITPEIRIGHIICQEEQQVGLLSRASGSNKTTQQNRKQLSDHCPKSASSNHFFSHLRTHTMHSSIGFTCSTPTSFLIQSTVKVKRAYSGQGPVGVARLRAGSLHEEACRPPRIRFHPSRRR